MRNFTVEEANLLCIYDTSNRERLMDQLTGVSAYLAPEDTEMRELIRSCKEKLRFMSDEDYAALSSSLVPDYE